MIWLFPHFPTLFLLYFNSNDLLAFSSYILHNITQYFYCHCVLAPTAYLYLLYSHPFPTYISPEGSSHVSPPPERSICLPPISKLDFPFQIYCAHLYHGTSKSFYQFIFSPWTLSFWRTRMLSCLSLYSITFSMTFSTESVFSKYMFKKHMSLHIE